jgi:trigger factor
MSPTKNTPTDETLDSEAQLEGDENGEREEEQPKLGLDVQIDARGACQRHITVTIPRADIERYFDNAIKDMMDKAAVPGFRPGRAPRKLVESRFRKDVTEQVKGTLLMDSLAQVTDDNKLAAISEPDLDLGAVEVPEEGDMTYEFDLEVRPEFDLPNWKGLKIERPVREFSEKDVDKQLQSVLAQTAAWSRSTVRRNPAIT